MSTRKREVELAAQLERTRRRFERWRRTRKGRTRIPDSLWASAVKIAGTCGVHRTAKTLRLDYYGLKKRLQEQHGAGEVAADSGATFLELTAPPSGLGQCVLEMEDAEGAKMRVRLEGVAAPDLAALSRSFWGFLS